MLKTDLAKRAAYRSMFTFRQSLEELDQTAVNGVDKAIENAAALSRRSFRTCGPTGKQREDE